MKSGKPSAEYNVAYFNEQIEFITNEYEAYIKNSHNTEANLTALSSMCKAIRNQLNKSSFFTKLIVSKKFRALEEKINEIGRVEECSIL